ncbi:NAD(P)/FAD-dependent oxidoreductase [Hydrotalea sandarakina]|jgi:protoporphyrinogen oxidase|uniref:Protoporphyrinogen oxidase n=1 Tax=Hydrotalea sandarakina TaxID=1004304 RepID=A0A2W7RF27_9BACT|nr:NAD(P)/FAD-dependent oxidoreductase [Hydrotalea sandarakina]PZX59513.1 protoporphyrinogen oxidase [Hydrotalea sandarakina]
MPETAVIIGAGPAGLTAAYELVTKTNIQPIILEQSADMGGISKTVVYKGNRIDIGGHRFFSKSDVVMQWWQQILPLQGVGANEVIPNEITYHRKKTTVALSPNGPNPDHTDRVMLIRKRVSRIFYLRKFFDYPISLSFHTLQNLGVVRVIKIGISYVAIRLFPLKKVTTLEEFFINRFGRELYKTFFKDYTEKVWGMPCNAIAADWGAQRIKELSVSKAIMHAIKSVFKKSNSIQQKEVVTSLIEQFMYPKLGPGQMWETVASIIREKGGIIITNAKVNSVNVQNNAIQSVSYINTLNGNTHSVSGNYFFSTMPVKELIAAMGNIVPINIQNISNGLQYRDFITVGLLLNKLSIANTSNSTLHNNLVPDNWIYIQERDVKIGRLQIFNNWSPYLVADPSKVWIGLEYFCNEGDALWQMDDKTFIQFAIDELHSIGIIDKQDVIDSTLIRMPKTYPAYFGTYHQFNVIRQFTDSFANLFLIGRNGMHKYNNQDHSMLTAIAAVNNIIHGITSKENIWAVNTEEDYHEK